MNRFSRTKRDWITRAFDLRGTAVSGVRLFIDRCYYELSWSTLILILILILLASTGSKSFPIHSFLLCDCNCTHANRNHACGVLDSCCFYFTYRSKSYAQEEGVEAVQPLCQQQNSSEAHSGCKKKPYMSEAWR